MQQPQITYGDMLPALGGGAVDGGPDLDLWRRRIRAGRSAREAKKSDWQQWARLHAQAVLLAESGQDLANAVPYRDRGSLGLIHRQVEQTLAQLVTTDVSVLAECVEFDREQGREDEHRESVVGQALTESLRSSGLLDGPTIADMVARDGTIVGFGVCYSKWRALRRRVPMGLVPEYTLSADGRLVPALDADGMPVMAEATREQVIREEVGDCYVSPLEFLFDAQAPSVDLSRWHAWERVMPLADLERDLGLSLSGVLTENEWHKENLYGETPGAEEVSERGVRVIYAFDKDTQEWLVLAEEPLNAGTAGEQRSDRTSVGDLTVLAADPYPALLEDWEASPFVVYVPIPANDRPHGCSQVELARAASLEGDEARMRQRYLTRQIKRVLLLDDQSGVSEDDVRKALARPDFSIVTMKNSLGVDLSKVLSELPTPNVHGDLSARINDAAKDVMDVGGVAEGPYSGADTATESENIRQVTGARLERKRQRWLAFLARVAQVHKALRARFEVPGRTVQVLGVDGLPLMLEYGREAFRSRFRLTMDQTGSAGSVSPVQLKADLELAGMIGPRLGPNAAMMMARYLLTRAGWQNINPLLKAMQADMMAHGMPTVSQVINAGDQQVVNMPQGMRAPDGSQPGNSSRQQDQNFKQASYQQPVGMSQGMRAPDGNKLADSFNPQDQTSGQAIRAGINRLFE